jgi:hypothetical protein
MGAVIGAVLLALVLGYLGLMAFLMSAMSDGARRWPGFLVSFAFFGAALWLLVFVFTHISIEVTS